MGRPVDRPEHRLAHQLDLVTARLDALDTIYEEARTHLHECLALAGDCHSVYAGGSDTTRRMANQAFFTRIYLDADDQITTEPTPSYRLLLDPSIQRQALTWASLHQNGKKRPTRALASQDEGSSKTHQVGDTGIEPVTSSV
jgi:site-specific DNA recombinase